ncbi:hypothetical protein LCGC14_2918030, partial [marine sediment metagenome]
MNALEPNPVKEKIRETKWIRTVGSTPSLALFRKTLIFDLLTLKRMIMSVFFMVLVPALILVFTPSENLPRGSHLVQLLGFVTWYYNFAILFPMVIINATGPLIPV